MSGGAGVDTPTGAAKWDGDLSSDGDGAGAGNGSGLSSIVHRSDNIVPVAASPATTASPASSSTASSSSSDDGDGGCCRCFRCLFCCWCCSTKAEAAPRMISPRAGALLPPVSAEDVGKKCLVLDLDETLVHSSFKPIPRPEFIIPVEIDGFVHHVYVRRRPGCDTFLKFMARRFEIVVFTASLAKYANPLLDKLDPCRYIRYRLYRESCVFHQGNYVKDLSLLGRPIESVIIVDNAPVSYMFHPENSMASESFIEDPNDRELLEMIPFLESIADVPDVRVFLHQWRSPGPGTVLGPGPVSSRAEIEAR